MREMSSRSSCNLVQVAAPGSTSPCLPKDNGDPFKLYPLQLSPQMWAAYQVVTLPTPLDRLTLWIFEVPSRAFSLALKKRCQGMSDRSFKSAIAATQHPPGTRVLWPVALAGQWGLLTVGDLQDTQRVALMGSAVGADVGCTLFWAELGVPVARDHWSGGLVGTEVLLGLPLRGVHKLGFDPPEDGMRPGRAAFPEELPNTKHV